MAAALGYEQFLIEDAVYPPRSPGLATLKNRVEFVSTEQVETIARVPAVAVQEDRPAQALIIVDIQNDFVHPQGAMQSCGYSHLSDVDRERIVANNRALAGAFRSRGWPVIFVRNVLTPHGHDTVLARSGLRVRPMPAGAQFILEGGWGAELVDGLAPEEGDIHVIKRGHSAFGFTPLHRTLRNLRVRRCVVTGGAVTGCISDTVREGVGLGYEMTIISDATYPAASPYLEVLANRGEVRPTAAVLAELAGALVT
jgi:ureidoacrylate peracid hydrolase